MFFNAVSGGQIAAVNDLVNRRIEQEGGLYPTANNLMNLGVFLLSLGAGGRGGGGRGKAPGAAPEIVPEVPAAPGARAAPNAAKAKMGSLSDNGVGQPDGTPAPPRGG